MSRALCQLLAAVFIGYTGFGATLSAYAQQRPRSVVSSSHDGVYAVAISTTTGYCDKVYHWTITVARGQITSPADGFMQASGEISPRGGVALAFRRDNQIATVTGRIKDKVGSGIWSSPTLQCAGSWSAIRQSDTPLRAQLQ